MLGPKPLIPYILAALVASGVGNAAPTPQGVTDAIAPGPTHPQCSTTLPSQMGMSIVKAEEFKKSKRDAKTKRAYGYDRCGSPAVASYEVAEAPVVAAQAFDYAAPVAAAVAAPAVASYDYAASPAIAAPAFDYAAPVVAASVAAPAIASYDYAASPAIAAPAFDYAAPVAAADVVAVPAVAAAPAVAAPVTEIDYVVGSAPHVDYSATYAPDYSLDFTAPAVEVVSDNSLDRVITPGVQSIGYSAVTPVVGAAVGPAAAAPALYDASASITSLGVSDCAGPFLGKRQSSSFSSSYSSSGGITQIGDGQIQAPAFVPAAASVEAPAAVEIQSVAAPQVVSTAETVSIPAAPVVAESFTPAAPVVQVDTAPFAAAPIAASYQAPAIQSVEVPAEIQAPVTIQQPIAPAAVGGITQIADGQIQAPYVVPAPAPIAPAPIVSSVPEVPASVVPVAPVPEVPIAPAPVESIFPEVPVESVVPEVPVESFVPEVPVESFVPEVPVESAVPVVPAPAPVSPAPIEFTPSVPSAPSSGAPFSGAPSSGGVTQIGDGQIQAPPLFKRQNGDPVGVFLNNGILTDTLGRTGYIADNRQLQFDGPPQSGAIYTAGFSACPDGALALGTQKTFYACGSGDFNNLYDQAIYEDNCTPVQIQLL